MQMRRLKVTQVRVLILFCFFQVLWRIVWGGVRGFSVFKRRREDKIAPGVMMTQPRARREVDDIERFGRC